MQGPKVFVVASFWGKASSHDRRAFWAWRVDEGGGDLGTVLCPLEWECNGKKFQKLTVNIQRKKSSETNGEDMTVKCVKN